MSLRINISPFATSELSLFDDGTIWKSLILSYTSVAAAMTGCQDLLFHLPLQLLTLLSLFDFD